jgi:hypothetical protein
MKTFMLIAFLIFSHGVGAETEDGVHSIVRGKGGEPHLVKFNSGVVKFIEQGEEEELAVFEKKIKKSAIQNTSLLQEPSEFEPTPVSDNEIKQIFSRMNPYISRKSECSDRAHVWAWDEFQQSGTKSEKAFLFLTNAYIVRNRYKWWFHVAPMYTTTSGQKMVLDYQFLDRPVTFTEWKNHLVFSKRECVTDFKFLDYDAGADQTQDCYTKAEPMYYFIPGDIAASERGNTKNTWTEFEVNASRSRAFFKGSN